MHYPKEFRISLSLGTEPDDSAQFEKELKENCDFIIVCYHGGFEKSLDENMTPTEALTKEKYCVKIYSVELSLVCIARNSKLSDCSRG